MPAFRIFPDRTLFALAEARPASEGALMAVTGVGTEARAALRFGPAEAARRGPLKALRARAGTQLHALPRRSRLLNTTFTA